MKRAALSMHSARASVLVETVGIGCYGGSVAAVLRALSARAG